MVTPFLSQTALQFGVNDMEGTVVREKIYHAVGAHTPQAMSLDEIVRADPRREEGPGGARLVLQRAANVPARCAGHDAHTRSASAAEAA